MEVLRNTPQDKMSAIISTEQVFFLGSGKPVPKSVVLQVAMNDLVCAEPIFVKSKGKESCFKCGASYACFFV